MPQSVGEEERPDAASPCPPRCRRHPRPAGPLHGRRVQRVPLHHQQRPQQSGSHQPPVPAGGEAQGDVQCEAGPPDQGLLRPVRPGGLRTDLRHQVHARHAGGRYDHRRGEQWPRDRSVHPRLAGALGQLHRGHHGVHHLPVGLHLGGHGGDPVQTAGGVQELQRPPPPQHHGWLSSLLAPVVQLLLLLLLLLLPLQPVLPTVTWPPSYIRGRTLTTVDTTRFWLAFKARLYPSFTKKY